MTNLVRLLAALAVGVLVGTLASPPLAAAPPPAHRGDVIELWRREPAPKKGRGGLTVVRWQDLKLVEVTRDDLQLGPGRTFRGVPLEALVRAAPRTAVEDTALLHFANGMQIPVPLGAGTLERLDVFVAREMKDPASGRFVDDLGKLVHERAPWMEQRAIVFSGNKLVVGDGWHPALTATSRPPPAGDGFSPWAHVDSLVGIELVNGAAWDGRLRVVEDPRILQGVGTFLARCQYCHGVRETGASFGWDFVKPVPLHTWRAPESLLYHVKFRKLEAAERGLLMPPQPDAGIDEIRALWDWMKAVTARDLRPYSP